MKLHEHVVFTVLFSYTDSFEKTGVFFFKQRQLNSDRSNSNYMDTFILSVR